MTQSYYITTKQTSAYASCSSHALKCQQLGVDFLLCFLQHSDQITSLVAVGIREERVCSASVGRTPRTTNTMHVVFRTVREVVVDDEFHILHI